MESNNLGLDSLVTDSYWKGIGRFLDYGLGSVDSRYRWPKNKASKTYAETVELKLRKSEEWRIAVASNDLNAKIRIAESVIKDWGKIKNISKKTIVDHINLCETLIDFPYKGVASYSKLLGVIEPARYAILDARVVVSLNAIQLLEQQKCGVFFPYLSGRNRITGDATQKRGFCYLDRFKVDSIFFENWRKPNKDEIYPIYLNFLRSTAIRLNIEICALEMSLFADAEKLALKCISDVK